MTMKLTKLYTVSDMEILYVDQQGAVQTFFALLPGGAGAISSLTSKTVKKASQRSAATGILAQQTISNTTDSISTSSGTPVVRVSGRIESKKSDE